MNFDLVLVTLTYRNDKDLTDFLDSLASLGCSYRVIVVNSFYDNESESAIRSVAQAYGCDFFSVENKGYGSGNNAGIRFALEHYQFQYLAVSNPDIRIGEFDLDRLTAAENAVVGPKILTLRGKNQNPIHYRRNFFVLFFRFLYAKAGFLPFFLAAILFNKLEKAVLRKGDAKGPRQVYALHGSFFLLPRSVLQTFGGKLFDERMFLFCEENHIAELARKHGVPIIYDPRFWVTHKEDGSISLENLDHFRITRESLKVFFENWKLFHR
ncbi:MAG TPA: glycosyltransferase [Clostridia bacterium]|nr:glycosyltransferase [Clostridia bacterium]